MATFLTRTLNDKSPDGKPRVYFTSHPDDFELYFDRLCNDILDARSCAVHFTEDMREDIDDAEREATLGRMNLFVVPVTFKLLCTPNRAMDSDLEFAKSRGIPILPFMMETGLEDFYSAPDKFGKRQYVSPASNDKTEISYKEKLVKHLSATLIGDELAERIRTAFAAYVFLSYRKKDRVYANKLIRLIHKIPGCYRLAVWYDEYLVPGEVFTDGIKRAMEGSKLFTLLVTPNLLEDPNYVMENEFPEARDMAMPILPAEMQSTDRGQLEQLYRDIPECIDAENEELFRERLLSLLSEVSVTDGDGDAERNFLIGLAYLTGIDVEVDRERAISLITSAAKTGLYEAELKLVELYIDEWDGFWDPEAAVKWGEALLSESIKTYGEDSEEAFRAMSLLASAYTALPCNDFEDITNVSKAIKLERRRHELLHARLGDNAPSTITSLCALVALEEFLDAPTQSSGQLYEQITAPECKASADLFDGLEDLIGVLERKSYYPDAIKWARALYTLRCRISGENDAESIKALSRISQLYMRDDNEAEAIRTAQKALAAAQSAFSDSSLEIVREKINLANIYLHFDRREEERALLSECRKALSAVYGEGHPETVSVLYRLGRVNFHFGEYALAKDQLAIVYPWRLLHLGKYSLKTLTSLELLASSALRAEDHAAAHVYYAELYRLVIDKKENDPIYRASHDVSDYESLLSHEGAALNGLAECCEHTGDYVGALPHLESLLSIVKSPYWREDSPSRNEVEDRIARARNSSPK